MKVPNQNRKFGSAQEYIVVRFKGRIGLATAHEAQKMLQRAEDNPEDVPSTFRRLLRWLVS